MKTNLSTSLTPPTLSIDDLQVTDFLACHFSQTIRCRFFEYDIPIAAHEVFHKKYLLCPILKGANDISSVVFSFNIIEDTVDDENARFGEVAVLEKNLTSLSLMIIIASAEQYLGVSSAQSGQPGLVNIDLSALFEQTENS